MVSWQDTDTGRVTFSAKLALVLGGVLAVLTIVLGDVLGVLEPALREGLGVIAIVLLFAGLIELWRARRR